MPQVLSGTYVQRIAQDTTVLYPFQAWFQTDTVDTGGGVISAAGYYQWTGLAWSSANPDVFSNITEIINASTPTQENYTQSSVMYADPSSASTGRYYAFRSLAAIRAAVTSAVSYLAGAVITVKNFGTGIMNDMVGISMAIENQGSPATVTEMIGMVMTVRNWLATTVTRGQGVIVSITNVGAGSMNAQEGMRISLSNTGGGTVSKASGIIINIGTATNTQQLVLGTSSAPSATYSIYNADTNPNYMAGSVTIGNTSVPSGGGTPVLIMNDTVSNPTGMPANTAGIFAKDVAGTTKLFAIDEAGTVTQLTP